MKITRSKISTGTLALAQYEIFKNKMNELKQYIENEIEVWGCYESIPERTKIFIDRELLTLGKYGKRIDIKNIEKKFEQTEV